MGKVSEYLNQLKVMSIGTYDEIDKKINPILGGLFFGCELGLSARFIRYSLEKQEFNPWLLPLYLDAGVRAFKMIRWVANSMKYWNAVYKFGEKQDKVFFPELDYFSGIVGTVREFRNRRNRPNLETRV